MKKSRRSNLQRSLLLQLYGQASKTTSELAKNADALYPSVSRSLQTLEQQELVEKYGNQWQLTNQGKQEAKRLNANFLEKTEEIQTIALQTRTIKGSYVMIDKGTIEMINSAVKAIRELGLDRPEIAQMVYQQVNAARPMLAEARFMARSIQELGLDQPQNVKLIQEAHQAYQASLSNMNHAQLIAINQNIINPLIEAQRLNSSTLANLSLVQAPKLLEIVNNNNLLLSKSLENLFAIGQAELAHMSNQATSSVNFASLAKPLFAVGSAYKDLLQQEFRLLNAPSIELSSVNVEKIVIPTTTVTYLTTSIRRLTEADSTEHTRSDEDSTDNSQTDPSDTEFADDLGDTSLDFLLQDLNPQFVEMRQGYWVAFYKRGPDYFRHAGVSQRELIAQLLLHFVPTNQLPTENRNGPQVKARVRKMFKASKSDAQFAESIEKLMYAQYQQLNKYTHHNKKHEESLRAVLQTGEGLIRFILALADKSQ